MWASAKSNRMLSNLSGSSFFWLLIIFSRRKVFCAKSLNCSKREINFSLMGAGRSPQAVTHAFAINWKLVLHGFLWRSRKCEDRIKHYYNLLAIAFLFVCSNPLCSAMNWPLKSSIALLRTNSKYPRGLLHLSLRYFLRAASNVIRPFRSKI